MPRRTKAQQAAPEINAPAVVADEDEGPEMVEREVVRPQPAPEVEQEPTRVTAMDLTRPQEDTEEQKAYFAAQLLGHQGHGPKFANIEDFRRRRQHQ